MAFEALRWPEGPVCPNASCRAGGAAIAKMGGVKRSHRAGLYRCKTCRRQFTVTVDTIFERSPLPLQDWLRAIHMFSATHSVTLREVEVELDVTYKTTLKIWTRICTVLRTYRGHNKGFGRKVEQFITSKRPKSRDWMTSWRKKSRELLNGEVGAPKALGVLSSFARDTSAPPEDFDRTERLARLLIAAKPNRKSARKKRRPTVEVKE